MSEKLKPCPFCGGEGMKRQNLYAKQLWRVACKNCDAGPSSVLGEDKAVAAWNRRHQDQSNQSEFERMLSK